METKDLFPSKIKVGKHYNCNTSFFICWFQISVKWHLGNMHENVNSCFQGLQQLFLRKHLKLLRYFQFYWKNDRESYPGDSDNSQSKAKCSKETASERKLGTVPTPHSTKYYEDRSWISYCLLDLSSLMNTFQKLVCNEVLAKWYQNSSLIHIECTKCKKKVYLQTPANCGGNGKPKMCQT